MFKYFKVIGNKMVAAVNFGCAFGFTTLQAGNKHPGIQYGKQWKRENNSSPTQELLTVKISLH